MGTATTKMAATEDLGVVVTKTVAKTAAAEAALVVETKMAANKTTKMAAALAALAVVSKMTANKTTKTAAEAVETGANAETEVVTASLPIRATLEPISGSTCNQKVSFHRNPTKI